MPPIYLELFTNDESLTRLCKLYWEIDVNGHFIHSASELCRQFNISLNELSEVVTQSCYAVSAVHRCSACRVPYVFSTRAEFQEENVPADPWTCEECRLEKEGLREAQRVAAEERYHRVIQDAYGSENNNSVDPSKLSLEDAVYLLSFIRLLATEDFRFAMPLEWAERLLSPTSQMDAQILAQLLRQHLISVSPNSRLTAFEGARAETIYLSKVHWQLPSGCGSMNCRDLAVQLGEILTGPNRPLRWIEECLDLWKKIALNECLQYLAVALDAHGFVFKPGEKTVLMFSNLLESYSVSQIYNLIWRAVKDAAAFYLRGGVTKQHAANTVVGGVERFAQRAKFENWPIKPFSRRFDCPQSVISEILFNFILQIGDDGFNKVPDMQWLSELPQFKLTKEATTRL